MSGLSGKFQLLLTGASASRFAARARRAAPSGRLKKGEIRGVAHSLWICYS